MVSIVVASLMMLSLWLVSCTQAHIDEEGAQPGEDTTSPVIVDTKILQEGNDLPKTQLQPKPSPELEDNCIGIHAHCFWNPEGQGIFPSGVLDAGYILNLGSKRARLGIKSLDSPDPDILIDVSRSEPEFSIDRSHDEFITSLAENGVMITYVLSFWDAEYVAQGGEVNIPRFKTEDEIQRYLDFVRFIVHHFKDRIEYYEIWNEPDIRDTIQWIEVADYIELVKRTIPVIRQEYPEAKIVVGGLSYLIQSDIQEYLFEILRSDIMPLVDVVSWHGMYGTSPEDDSSRKYYYEYPSIVQEIKDVASTNGFTGEFVSDEIHWQTHDQAAGGKPTYSEVKSAKYLARSIIMHLGMDVSVTTILLREKPQILHTFQNTCTIMSGAEPVAQAIEVEIEVENLRSYCFSSPDGSRLLSLWVDGIATDDNPSIEATLAVPNFSAQKVTAIDVLIGFEQELITSTENGNTVIHNLLVKDYPIILRLTP
jgi:hypothetical protein